MYFSEVFGPIKWHTLVAAVLMWLLPAIKFFVSPQAAATVLLVLAIANAVFIFFSGIILTVSEGFKWYYPIVIGFLYAASVPVYYENYMLVNALVYVSLTYASEIIGIIIRKIIERSL